MKQFLLYALLSSAGVWIAQPAVAQSVNEPVEIFSFNVPAGRLPDVVEQIAAQARASVAIRRSETNDVRIDGVVGILTLRQALTQALAGTDLTLEPDGSRSFRIVNDTANYELVVIARREDFARTNSSLLTRTNTPIRQTPGRIESVTEEVLRSQNVISVSEAVRNLPGVLFNSSQGSSQLLIGQSSSGERAYVNGLQGSSLANNPPVTDIEAIELLKGPAVILQGATLAGGVINYVPKRATGRPGGDVTIGFGSGRELLGSADIGGAIDREAGLFWRVALLGEYAQRTPGGGNDPHQYAINPMFGYRGDGIRFDATFQFFDKRTAYPLTAAYLPATGQVVDYGPSRISRDNGADVTSRRGSYSLEVDLLSSDAFSLTFRNRGLYQTASRTGQLQFPYAYDLLGLGTYVVSSGSRARDQQLSEYADLYARFATGPISHQVILAGDLTHSKTDNAPSTFDAGYSSDTISLPVPGIPTLARASRIDARQYGLIFQDQMTLGSLHALVGLRETFFNSKPYSRNAANTLVPGVNIVKDSQLSVNAGVVYDLARTISAYFSYSTAYTPPYPDLLTIDRQLLPATTRTQYEIGVKAGLFADKLNVNVSANQFTTDNSSEPNPSNPIYYRAAPGLKGKGVDVSIAGSLTQSLKVLAGYAYSESHTPGLTRPATGVPKNVANLWAIQTIEIDEDRSVNVGFGGNYNSGFFTQDFVDGRYYYFGRHTLTANGSLAYKVGNLTINGVVNNILDRRNYRPSGQPHALLLDVPRSFRVTLRAGF